MSATNCLGEKYSLDSWMSKISIGVKTALVVLVNYFHQDLNRRSTTLLVLSDFSVAFKTINARLPKRGGVWEFFWPVVLLFPLREFQSVGVKRGQPDGCSLVLQHLHETAGKGHLSVQGEVLSIYLHAGPSWKCDGSLDLVSQVCKGLVGIKQAEIKLF